MPDVPDSPLHASSSLLFDACPPAAQPQTNAAAHKNAAASGPCAQAIPIIRPTPHGWMQSDENFLPDGAIVVSMSQFAATQALARPAPAPVAALPAEPAAPDLSACLTWGSHDGSMHGYVQRQRWGVTLLATSGVSGCRTTASVTLQPYSARLLAHVLNAVYAAAQPWNAADCYSLQWGDPGGVHGRVTRHRWGIDLTATAETGGDSITTTVQFRGIGVVPEVGRLLFAQADAHDAEFGGNLENLA